MPRAFGYVRQFCDPKDDETLVAQRQSIRDHFESRLKPQGFTWGGFFEDGRTSGGRPFGSRPEGLRLDLEVETGDVVVLPKLTVIGGARDLVQVVGRWNKRGVVAHFVAEGVDTSTPMGKVFLQVGAEFVEMRRSHRSERMQESIAQRKSLGLSGSGRAPYGFRNVGPSRKRRLAPDPFTRKVGRWVVRLKFAGYSWTQLYWPLFSKGRRKRQGKEWTITTLLRMFDGECRLLEQTEAGRAKLLRWQQAGLEMFRKAGRKVEPDAETEPQ
jgi:DNA invertase Pin-like site-specific DNA recombinase